MRLKYERAAMFFLQTRTAEGGDEGVEPKQKAVRPEEIDSYLEAGWVYVATLPDGRVIVGKGNSP